MKNLMLLYVLLCLIVAPQLMAQDQSFEQNKMPDTYWMAEIEGVAYFLKISAGHENYDGIRTGRSLEQTFLGVQLLKQVDQQPFFKLLGQNHLVKWSNQDKLFATIGYHEKEIKVEISIPEKQKDYWAYIQKAKELNLSLEFPKEAAQQFKFKPYGLAQYSLRRFAEAVNEIHQEILVPMSQKTDAPIYTSETFLLDEKGQPYIAENLWMGQGSVRMYSNQILEYALSPITTGQRGSTSGSIYVTMLNDVKTPTLVVWGSRHYSPGIQDRDPKMPYVKDNPNAAAPKAHRNDEYLDVRVFQKVGEKWVQVYSVKQETFFQNVEYCLNTHHQMPQFIFIEKEQASVFHWDEDKKQLSLKRF